MPVRKCPKCKFFLPGIISDPHPTCNNCRGGACTFSGKRCEFCIDWPKEKWDSFVPVKRPHSSRPKKPKSTERVELGCASMKRPRPDKASGISATATGGGGQVKRLNYSVL